MVVRSEYKKAKQCLIMPSAIDAQPPRVGEGYDESSGAKLSPTTPLFFRQTSNQSYPSCRQLIYCWLVCSSSVPSFFTFIVIRDGRPNS